MPPLEKLNALVAQARGEIAGAQDPSSVEALRVKYLGKKGEISLLLRGMAELPPAERPAFGAAVNRAKDEVEALLAEARARAEEAALERELAASRVDVTEPGRRAFRGARHPVARAMEEIVGIFERLGFSVASGPEVEDDFHNFEALNFPPDHPARDMQDTFFLEGGKLLLRTHTSPVQVRVMRSRPPPVRVVCPGKVFRSDADVTHSPMFHQVEGLLVDERVTMAELKGTLQAFARAYFGPEVKVRLRPSYFPFVEPGAEVDVSCVLCSGQGTLEGQPHRVCKGTGWLEVLGAGMVHPNVFRAVGYDPERVTGFAFGLGVERLAMLKHAIGDIRVLFDNDARFLEQMR